MTETYVEYSPTAANRLQAKGPKTHWCGIQVMTISIGITEKMKTNFFSGCGEIRKNTHQRGVWWCRPMTSWSRTSWRVTSYLSPNWWQSKSWCSLPFRRPWWPSRNKSSKHWILPSKVPYPTPTPRTHSWSDPARCPTSSSRWWHCVRSLPRRTCLVGSSSWRQLRCCRHRDFSPSSGREKSAASTSSRKVVETEKAYFAASEVRLHWAVFGSPVESPWRFCLVVLFA